MSVATVAVVLFAAWYGWVAFELGRDAAVLVARNPKLSRVVICGFAALFALFWPYFYVLDVREKRQRSRKGPGRGPRS